jgi:hypothetical protein
LGEGSLREAAMTKAKKDAAGTRWDTKKPKVKRETIRDLDPEEQGRQVKGGARTCSRAPQP